MGATNNDKETPEILTVREVKDRLRCSVSQVYRLFARGELVGFRVGASVRIEAGSLASYKERQSNRKPAPVEVPPLRPGKREVKTRRRAGQKIGPKIEPNVQRYFGDILN